MLAASKLFDATEISIAHAAHVEVSTLSMKRIFIKETYSRLAPPGSTASEIGGRRLSAQQLKTYELLADPAIDIVFNTALTGDGKSLAAYLPALRDGRFTIGLYPTNELSRDQEKQVRSYSRSFSTLSREPRICRLTGDLLTEYADSQDLSRQTALLTQIQQREILLTNPDIYHLVMNGYYLKHKDARDKVASRLVNNFDLVVFDEFHVFRAPQVVSVLNSILLTRTTTAAGRKKFLFLSATPSQQLKERLDRASIPCAMVEGEYVHCRADERAAIDLDQYRRISREVELCFDVVGRTDKTAEAWVTDHAIEAIGEFFRVYPGSRCAVIFNSVGAVKRCVPKLRVLLQGLGLTVGENTGLSSESDRAESFDKDILVGTSTIDIGVDFRINLLIFEAVDAGSFIQRLGRLGRHDGYEDADSRFIPFHAFRGYALTPQFISERLFEKPDEHTGAPPLRPGDHYGRDQLNEIVRECYPDANDFRNYASRWGGLQSAHVYYSLGQPVIRSAYQRARKELRDQYEQVCGIRLSAKLAQMRGYLRSGEKEKKRRILDTARSFRGWGELECGVIDRTSVDERDQFLTYGLPGLLTNCVIADVLTKDQFESRVRAAGLTPARFRYCRLFLEVSGYRQAPARWMFYWPVDLSKLRIDDVGVDCAFRVVRTESDYENRINQILRNLRLVYYIVPLDRFDAARRKRLPQMFPLYPLADTATVNDRQPPSHSIAFGLEALMMESIFFYQKDRKAGWIV